MVQRPDKKPYVVFDFDGTIANSITPGLVAVNDLISTLGVDQITEEKFQELRHKSYSEIITAFDIPMLKVPRLLLQLRNKMKENIEKVHPYPYIPYVLQTLNKRGHYLFVLTSNSKELVVDFMERHGITVFEDIFSEKNFFGKAGAITRFMKLQGIKAEDMIYLGDEVRDVEACKKSGVDIISVTWGFNSEDILVQHGPTYIARKPKEILTIIEAIT
jgi:HAD superfamily hydrolase (TIGR01549 family)